VTFDSETSAVIAKRVRAQPRRCWRNASRAVRHLGEGALYVEGWAVTNRQFPLVIEHGWCEVDGRIVDPSYSPYVGPHEPPLAYFGGMRFDFKKAEAALAQRKLPIAWLRADQAYSDAFDAAWHLAVTRSALEPLPKTRVVNCRRESSDVFIGRPSKWGNPFHVGRDGTRTQVIAKYREWLIRQPLLLREVLSLRGKALGCDCAPEPCHGDVLAKLADMDTQDGPDSSVNVIDVLEQNEGEEGNSPSEIPLSAFNRPGHPFAVDSGPDGAP
jgi:hypothetical protein